MTLINTVIIGSEPHGTHDHILPSDGCESLQVLPSLSDIKFKVKVKVILRLAVYRQTVRLGAKPLEANDQRLFFQLNPCGHSPYVTSSVTRGYVCLL
jgi:hypothetical protein